MSSSKDRFVIQIPATDFSPCKQTTITPPRRLQQQQSATSRNIISRQSAAAANRAATLRSRKLKCHKHATHVQQVVKTLRESRYTNRVERLDRKNKQLARAAASRHAFQRRQTAVLNGIPMSPVTPQQRQHQRDLFHGRKLDFEDVHDDERGRCEAGKKLVNVILIWKARVLLKSIGLSGHSLHKASFEVISDRMCLPTATLAIQYILTACKLNGNKSIKPRDCRIILSSYLIALHPSITASSPTSTSKSTEVVTHARVLLFMLLHLPLTRISDIGKCIRSWGVSFMNWKKGDVKNVTGPLIKEAIALNERYAKASCVLKASADVANVRRQLASDYMSDGSNENERREELDNELKKRQADIRDAVYGVGGSNGVKALDRALQRASEDSRSKHLHELLLDPERLADQLSNAAMGDVDVDMQQLREELKMGRTDGILCTKLAWVSRILNTMRNDCFQLPVGSGTGLDVSYACGVVESIYDGCIQCQAEIDDAALTQWRDTCMRKIRQAGGGGNNDELVEEVCDGVLKGIAFVLRAYKDVVKHRVLMDVSLLDRDGGSGRQAAMAMERKGYAQGVRDGRFAAGLPKTVLWMRRSKRDYVQMIGNGVNVVNVLVFALIGLIEDDGVDIDTDGVCEILWMDVHTLQWMQQQLRSCCVEACSDVLGRQRSQRNGEDGNNELLDEMITRIRDKNAHSHDDAVYKLMKKRIIEELVSDSSMVHNNKLKDKLWMMAVHIHRIHDRLVQQMLA